MFVSMAATTYPSVTEQKSGFPINRNTRFVCTSPYGKNYLKLFGESLFKTIKIYSNYLPMINWRTIGGNIGKNY